MSDQSTAAPAETRPGWAMAGTALLSVATLHLELLQTRLFSVMLWNHLVYMVITLAIMGFAISGTLLHVVGPLRRAAPLTVARWSALGFALSTLACFALSARVQIPGMDAGPHSAGPSGMTYVALSAYYSYHVIPFVFAGLGILAALSLGAASVHRLYFANLVGSGVGCLVFVLTITPLGAPRSLGVIAVVGCAAALAFAQASARRGSAAVIVCLGVAIMATGWAERVFVIPIAKAKLFYWLNPDGREPIERQLWTPLCRLDVIAWGGQKQIFQDGDAATAIFPWDPDHEPNPAAAQTHPFQAMYKLGYVGRQVKKVLIIGVGGGRDLLEALHQGATEITGAELNPAMRSLMRNEYAELSGRLYYRPEITVHASEGRSFVRHSAETYDQIQLTGTDTFVALSSGAYILSESYLYTVEAVTDFLTHLAPEGRLVYARPRFDPPRENLRLVAVGVHALRELGVEHPERHVIVVGMTLNGPLDFSTVVFKREPFTDAEVQAYREWCRIRPGISVFYAPGEAFSDTNAYAAFMQYTAEGREARFVARYPYNIAPVTDDAPFFFRYYKWSALFRPQERDESLWWALVGNEPIGLYVMGALLGASTLLTVILAVLPLALRRTGGGGPRAPAILAFVAALGFGFIAIEISMTQRFVLLLGHPTFALSVCIATFLVASGVGSMIAGRLPWSPRHVVTLGIAGLTVTNLAILFAYPPLAHATLSMALPWRVLISVLVLAPPAFFMGMPFPTGLAWMHEHDAQLVPWAWAVNGGTSVVGSILAIVIAMAAGFTTVLWIAVGVYLLGLAAFHRATAAGESVSA